MNAYMRFAFGGLARVVGPALQGRVVWIDAVLEWTRGAGERERGEASAGER